MMRVLLVLACVVSLNGCAQAYKKSRGGETDRIVTQIYLSDFDTVWQSTLDALKHNRLDISNRESGFIQTRWTDNTTDKNFVDSFGSTDAYLKAQYRFRVSVTKGHSYERNRPAVKVTVQKEQLIERDVLEGWRPVETEPTEENTLLYRVGRLILIRMKLAKIEDEKTRKAIEQTKF